MAQYDHSAIMKAYPNQISSIVDGVGVTNKDGKMFEPDADLVAAARAELDKEIYKGQRKYAYPDWGSQLDYIYHNGIDKWKTDVVDPVKKKYPKPS